jgi:hypothetical protein
MDHTSQFSTKEILKLSHPRKSSLKLLLVPVYGKWVFFAKKDDPVLGLERFCFWFWDKIRWKIICVSDRIQMLLALFNLEKGPTHEKGYKRNHTRLMNRRLDPLHAEILEFRKHFHA